LGTTVGYAGKGPHGRRDDRHHPRHVDLLRICFENE
jgi:hypothetical protein